MKITYKTAAQSVLLLAACLAAAAQSEITPDHFPDQASPVAFAPRQESQALQERLERYQQELRAKSELVENARQMAISAGIQGDGAGPFIDAYRQEQKELESLQAALTLQIEQTRTAIANAMMANLTLPSALSDSAPSPKVKPAWPMRAVVAANNSYKIH